MGITFLKAGGMPSREECQFIELNNFCSDRKLNLTFEWMEGQFWLHSDRPGEAPIGPLIDQELKRHEQYFKKSSLHKELLARAVGIKGAFRPKIIDLSAGLLGDSLLFLAMGCEVVAIERHPVVCFLLKSALQNSTHPYLERLSLMEGDALDILPKLKADVLYFDPMFDDVNEKTAPRKEMRIFRSLVGGDPDAGDVFQKVRLMRPRRLVIKRPRLSEVLGAKSDVQYKGKSTRYDVYFSLQND
jgi:hypothetical protein